MSLGEHGSLEERLGRIDGGRLAGELAGSCDEKGSPLVILIAASAVTANGLGKGFQSFAKVCSSSCHCVTNTCNVLISDQCHSESSHRLLRALIVALKDCASFSNKQPLMTHALPGPFRLLSAPYSR